MKTPWKFLAELVSGRKPVEVAEKPAQQDRKLIEIEARPAPVLQLNSPQPDVELQDEKSTQQDVAEVAATAEIDDAVEQSIPIEQTTAAQADGPADNIGPQDAVEDNSAVLPEPRKSGRAASPRKAKASSVSPTLQSPKVAHEDLPAVPASSGNTFFDEASSLDEEIKQLRDQLAQKLRQQNDQLKKLLERYERP